VTGSYVTLVHDVAVTNVTSDRTWVYYDHGFNAHINVTVQNNGDFNETVTVTLYYSNATFAPKAEKEEGKEELSEGTVGAQIMNVSAGQNGTVTFTWNTTGIAYPQNYTLTAVASIPADINLTDNTLQGGTIEVRIPGDINGEGKVDIYDAIAIASYFGLHEGQNGWNPDADLNHDGKIDIFDMIIVASYFGQTGSP
jgi:uncharacterized protein (DUF2141 family)